ncbi:MBL fold metallo-hydrolase [Sulfurivirga sp.]|uniref:MBL fold metallo-hydrolase n=1 Tax=Sulfurivirga sp. TaxID=2614236 RepID=UPI0025D32D7E|nr:MBL fold metallo-hydrolase [Sulfurivirga sp.]
MFLQQRIVPQDPSSLAYLFGCAGQGQAIAVDVFQGDEQWFLDEAERLGVRIRYVVDTHVHADHFSGGPALAEKSGAEYVLWHQAPVKHTFLGVQEGDVLTVGNVQARVIYTPGHTPDHICLIVTDRSRGDEPWFVITGHTLFVGSVGRPDLHGQAERMAHQLFDTLHTKLMSLPDNMEIWPGAKAGSVCGVGLSAKPVSTIGFEKRFNEMLSLPRNSFVEKILGDLPPEPKEKATFIAFNKGEHNV